MKLKSINNYIALICLIFFSFKEIELLEIKCNDTILCIDAFDVDTKNRLSSYNSNLITSASIFNLPCLAHKTFDRLIAYHSLEWAFDAKYALNYLIDKIKPGGFALVIISPLDSPLHNLAIKTLLNMNSRFRLAPDTLKISNYKHIFQKSCHISYSNVTRKLHFISSQDELEKTALCLAPCYLNDSQKKEFIEIFSSIAQKYKTKEGYIIPSKTLYLLLDKPIYIEATTK
jgi:hypothetical protein